MKGVFSLSKLILKKQLVNFNFDKNEFRFYDVETLSIGYNRMQVITSYGNLGTKGREQITRFEGSDESFKEARKFSYNKIYEKKNEQYFSLERVKEVFHSIPKIKELSKRKKGITKLVYFNFEKNEYRFYNVEVLSVGHNSMQVLSSYGRLGTKGKELVTRFQGNDEAFKEAYQFAQRKIQEKANDGYFSREQALEYYARLFPIKKVSKKKTEKPVPEKQRIPFGYDCDKCRKTIKPEMYEKINNWARGTGNWDSISDLKGKVYCLDCQFDFDIFQKKLSPENYLSTQEEPK